MPFMFYKADMLETCEVKFKYADDSLVLGPRPMMYSLTVKRHALKPFTSTLRNEKLRTTPKFFQTFRQHTETYRTG